MRRTGFTLAEILITLTIIGVIASMTIPPLINNVQDQQNKVAWKKAYADFSQVTMNILADNGGSFKNLCNDSDHNCMRDLYSKYLNYVKKCDIGANQGTDKCWTQHKYLDNTIGANYNSYAGVILNNGNVLTFAYRKKDCSDTSETYTGSCGVIVIDVNGPKSPNMAGKDVYGIYIYDNKAMPCGSNDRNIIPGGSYAYTGFGYSSIYLYQ